MNGVALVLTVGGSHEPIIAAIEDLHPDYVVFVCSEDYPNTGNPGSYTQIILEGKIIKAHFSDDKPTLENIPTQVGLAKESFNVIQIPSDEIDNAYITIAAELKILVDEYSRVVCDYTGGTKSMSSSLVLAAVDNSNVEVQVVAGSRSNLRRIETAFQMVQSANVGQTRFTDSLSKALKNWEQYNYATAVIDLNAITTVNRDDRVTLHSAQTASKAFAAWDVFNHAEAKTILNHISKKLSADHRIYQQQIGMLCSDTDIAVPNRIFDLWLNAERCAVRGRYDDATSRVYRLMEWCSQWLLQYHKNIDTADIAESDIPPKVTIPFNSRKKKYMASLVQSWELASATCGVSVDAFWKENKESILDHLEIRNHSILAHGYDPISKQQWSVIERFARDQLLPFMLEQFKPLKIQKLPTQLPTEWIV